MMKTFAVLSLCVLAHSAVISHPVSIPKNPAKRSHDAKPRIVPRQLETRNAETEAQWQTWNNITANAWMETSYPHEIVERSIPEPYRSKSKRDIDTMSGPFRNWTAQGFSQDTWGSSFFWYQTACENDGTENAFASGIISKNVAKEVSGNYVSTFWYNRTTWWYASESETYECELYSHEPWDCNNQVTCNWSTNNASFNGHTVRTIKDCLLGDITAVQYNTIVNGIGAKPIQYYINGLKYYRWYDNNNFAWFAACPTSWQRREMKRQGINGKNSNPVWDFETDPFRNSRRDSTPFPTHLIQDYHWQRIYHAMVWPKENQQTIQIEGETCQVMALSRPGLRHWTARMIDIPPQTYISIQDEFRWPESWDSGANKYSKSSNDADEFFWGSGA